MERTANRARLYEEQGYLFPLPALTTEAVGRYRGEVEELPANHGEAGREVLRHKAILYDGVRATGVAAPDADH
ncbi:MAG: hypothetical protein QGI13_17085 [Rhodospirillales bacterium]|jgi:hypothetical protein|nr:hypothetical protein [Rhodospirillales bacterium]